MIIGFWVSHAASYFFQAGPVIIAAQCQPSPVIFIKHGRLPESGQSAIEAVAAPILTPGPRQLFLLSTASYYLTTGTTISDPTSYFH